MLQIHVVIGILLFPLILHVASSPYDIFRKRDALSNCQQKLNSANECVGYKLKESRNLVTMVKNRRAEEAKELYKKVNPLLEDACQKKSNEYFTCCADAGNCNLFELDFEEMNREEDLIDFEMKRLTSKTFQEFFLEK